MDAQLSLPGIAPAPRRTERFYFAILPEPAVQPRLVALGRELCAGWRARYRPTSGHRLHVSMHHLGDHVSVPEKYIRRAMGAVAGIRRAAFDIRFDQAMIFSGRSRGDGQFPLVLYAIEDSGPIHDLSTALAQVLQQAGLPADFGSRLPHVTLGYINARMAPRKVSDVCWRVRDFALVHVHLGMAPGHRIMGRWRLADFTEVMSLVYIHRGTMYNAAGYGSEQRPGRRIRHAAGTRHPRRG